MGYVAGFDYVLGGLCGAVLEAETRYGKSASAQLQITKVMQATIAACQLNRMLDADGEAVLAECRTTSKATWCYSR
jgi:hypothetical protein